MAEIQYSPDPRPSGNLTHQSRRLGRREVYQNKAPAAPVNKQQPAISYTDAGAESFWNVSTQAWVAAS